MRTVTIGDWQGPIHGAAWTQLEYSQAFQGHDLLADMASSADAPGLTTMRAAWACARTANPQLEDFDMWVRGLGQVDMSAENPNGWVQAVIAELRAGLFRRSRQDVAPTVGR